MLGISRELQKDELTAVERQMKCAYLASNRSILPFVQFLSHELNQPLTAITVYVSGCIKHLEHNNCKDIQEVMKNVLRNVEQMSLLIQRAKDSLPSIKLHIEKINIQHVIKNAVLLLMSNEIDYSTVDIRYDFTDDFPMLQADEAQIQLAILYLLKYAVEELFIAKIDLPIIIIKIIQRTNFALTISINDNGRGIPPEIHNKLFHTYFTTKANHTSLGLLTCKSIIDAHQGHITSHTIPGGGGTIFEVTLPIVNADYLATAHE